jgi:hypothetical protein
MDKQTTIINKATSSEDGKKLWATITSFLNASDKPVKVTIEENKKCRTVESNKLQRKWTSEAETQGDMTREEYRGYCKLHFGIEIAKENEEFAEKYDRLLKHLTYAEKMEFMMVPFDMPVTRIFNTNQMHRYLNKMREHFTGIGFQLTIPVDKYWESVFNRVDNL